MEADAQDPMSVIALEALVAHAAKIVSANL